MKSDWFSEDVEVNTFQLEELLATKLRALYERKKGRDAFDLWLAINEKEFDAKKLWMSSLNTWLVAIKQLLKSYLLIT